MTRFRQVAPLFIFALVSLLYCSQACLALGHGYAVVATSSHESDSVDAQPCHSHAPSPQNTEDQCQDCGERLFLTSPSSSADVLTLARNILSVVCIFAHPSSSPAIASHAYHREHQLDAFLPPRYLSLSVLQL